METTDRGELGPDLEALPLVLRFVNTRATGAGHVEAFANAAAFAGWAAEHGLLDANTVVTESDAAAARELRAAVITVLRSHAEELDDQQIVTAETFLRQAGQRYPLASAITGDGARLLPVTSGVPGALSAVLAAVTQVASGPDWMRLKVCNAPTCRYGFTDRTRNRSGRYCKPACASRVAMRALRQRRLAPGT